MKFDTIRFQCEAVENPYYGTGDSDYLTKNHRDLIVSVIINNFKVEWNNKVCPYSIALGSMDHKPRWPDGEVIGYWSIFYPFTCGCDCAGCAGIWDGIYVRPRRYSVEWRASKKDGYTFLPKTFFNFERKAYESAIEDMLLQIEFLSYKEYWLVVDAGYCKEHMVTGLDFVKYVRNILQK